MIPSISVIIPSYNHADYIRAAVESVLAQTVAPSEIIIVDDGSTDQSAAVIRAFRNERVTAVMLGANRGACAAINEGLRRVTGEFVAICNSDDVWASKKLERQLELLEERPDVGAVFTDVEFIADDGAVRRDLPPSLSSAFAPAYLTRWGWLRELIESRNRLCHPSILARAHVYEKIGGYDNRFRQLPDLHMWLRILEHFDIHVLEERLVQFRLHADNTSRPSPGAIVRDRNEFATIVEEFFRRVSAENFFLAFGSVNEPDDAARSLVVEKILYLVNRTVPHSPIFNYLGCRLAMELLNTEEGRNAWSAYGFSMADFHTLHGLSSPWVSRETLGPPNANELEVARRLTSSFLVDSELAIDPRQNVPRKKRRAQKIIDFIRGKNRSAPFG